jgi:hypothetical protein
MNDLFCPLPEPESVLFVGGQQSSSPGFQIGGKSGGFNAFFNNLEDALGKSQGVPTVNPGNSSKTGDNGLYPGGLNTETYFGLLDRNPIFDISPNL